MSCPRPGWFCAVCGCGDGWECGGGGIGGERGSSDHAREGESYEGEAHIGGRLVFLFEVWRRVTVQLDNLQDDVQKIQQRTVNSQIHKYGKTGQKTQSGDSYNTGNMYTPPQTPIQPPYLGKYASTGLNPIQASRRPHCV